MDLKGMDFLRWPGSCPEELTAAGGGRDGARSHVGMEGDTSLLHHGVGWDTGSPDEGFIALNVFEPMKPVSVKKTDNPSCELQSLWTDLYWIHSGVMPADSFKFP